MERPSICLFDVLSTPLRKKLLTVNCLHFRGDRVG